jgi:poly-gamma-glutamate capsule biosynthesis protein CapA/YwtB (metallophosphatase superfamily)
MKVSSSPRFPYRYTPEKTPSYTLTRAEGLSFEEAASDGFNYVRKYLFKKETAPVETVAHFQDQKRLFAYLQSSQKLALSTSLAMVGDIVWVRDSWDRFVQPGVLEQLSRSDVRLGNLETPISQDHPVPEWAHAVHRFNSRPELLTSFAPAQFTAVSTANNHSLDQGVEGARNTLSFLKEQGILQSGMGQPGEKRFTTFTHHGIKFGLYACTWGLNNPAAENPEGWQLNLLKGQAPRVEGKTPPGPPDLGEIRQVLAQMEGEGVEVKIASLHWGHEYEHYPLPEQMQLAREVVAAGADVIMGHHPHVVQPSEVLFVNGAESELPLQAQEWVKNSCLEDPSGRPRKALVTYSLGNFCTNDLTQECQIGAIARMEFGRDEKGQVIWQNPSTDFVYNRRGAFYEGDFGPRQLLTLDEDAPSGFRKTYEEMKERLPGAVSL